MMGSVTAMTDDHEEKFLDITDCKRIVKEQEVDQDGQDMQIVTSRSPPTEGFLNRQVLNYNIRSCDANDKIVKTMDTMQVCLSKLC
jgi:hypothetical protein